MPGPFLTCPACGKRSVYWRAAPGGNDAWLCRTPGCPFDAYSSSTSSLDQIPI